MQGFQASAFHLSSSPFPRDVVSEMSENEVKEKNKDQQILQSLHVDHVPAATIYVKSSQALVRVEVSVYINDKLEIIPIVLEESWTN